MSWALGYIDFDSVKSFGGVYVPVPFKYGLDFDLSAFISLSIIFIITAIEAYGDITANSMISGEPVEGDLFMKRASGGVVANGVSSFISAALNSFPNSIFAQNNGMIQLTGVASRYVGYFISAFLIILSVFPAVSLVFSLMPEPVLGGATLLMFGTVAASGIKVIASQKLGRKEILMLAAHGVEVTGTDYNKELVDTLNAGRLSFKEDGLEELYQTARETTNTCMMVKTPLSLKRRILGFDCRCFLFAP